MRTLRIAIMLLWVACTDRGSGAPHKASSADDAGVESHTPARPSVAVVQVASRMLQTVVRLEGELTPYEAVAIFPRVTGLVAAIPVDRGSVVRRGQLLVRLVAPELVAQRAEAETKALVEQTSYDRLEAASKTPGVVAGHDLELAAAALRGSRERAQSLAAQQAYLEVRAPFDGIISERNVHPGALVGPTAGNAAASPMVRLEQVARLRLTVAVPELYAGEIVEGEQATFTVRSWPQRSFQGTIRRRARALDLRTRSMPVELDVENPDGALAPGMFAKVDWTVTRHAPSLFVPAQAIVASTESLFVARVRDGVVERVPVQRGIAMGDDVEVFGALAEHDLVAQRGSEELRPGTAVSPRLVHGDAGTKSP